MQVRSLVILRFTNLKVNNIIKEGIQQGKYIVDTTYSSLK